MLAYGTAQLDPAVWIAGSGMGSHCQLMSSLVKLEKLLTRAAAALWLREATWQRDKVEAVEV
jgi:hypothetical protein